MIDRYFSRCTMIVSEQTLLKIQSLAQLHQIGHSSKTVDAAYLESR